MKLVLGSSSIFRRKVLIAMLTGQDPTLVDLNDPKNEDIVSWISPDIDEKAIRDTNPYALTMKIANAKIDAILKEHKVWQPLYIKQIGDNLTNKIQFEEETLVITSDQVTVFNGEIREKPISREQGREFFNSYSEIEPAVVVNSVIVTNTKTGDRLSGSDTAKQYWKSVPSDVLEAAMDQGDILQCCGCFMIDEPLLKPYLGERIGEESSIMGLPETLVSNLLRTSGYVFDQRA